MSPDDVAAETIGDGGGPVELTAVERVLHRVTTMATTLTVPFTPHGPDDMATTLDASKAMNEMHLAGAGVPVDSGDHFDMTHVAFDADLWRSMGEPDTITIRVDPGDTLSTPHQADGMGPVTSVMHIPDRTGTDSTAVVRHDGHADEPAPQHDDVTNDDVRIDTTQ